MQLSINLLFILFISNIYFKCYFIYYIYKIRFTNPFPGSSPLEPNYHYLCFLFIFIGGWHTISTQCGGRHKLAFCRFLTLTLSTKWLIKIIKLNKYFVDFSLLHKTKFIILMVVRLMHENNQRLLECTDIRKLNFRIWGFLV